MKPAIEVTGIATTSRSLLKLGFELAIIGIIDVGIWKALLSGVAFWKLTLGFGICAVVFKGIEWYYFSAQDERETDRIIRVEDGIEAVKNQFDHVLESIKDAIRFNDPSRVVSIA